MSNGIRTTNLERQFSIDELIGNVTDEGVEKTARIPMTAIANVLAGTGAFVFGNMVYVATLAQLTAITPDTETAGGVVLNDPDPTKNGYYYRESAAWVKGRGFPDTFAVLTSIGGTANAITASAEAGVSPADVLCVLLPDPPGTNTSSTVTLTIAGETLPIKAASGGNLANGDIIEGVGTLLFRFGSEWRQVSSSATGAMFDHQGDWNGVTTYTEGQVVTGSNGNWFQLKDPSSLNDDPVGSVTGAWLMILSAAGVADGSVTDVKLANSLKGKLVAFAANRAALAQFDGTTYQSVDLMEDGRKGMFQWNSANLTSFVSADIQQGIYVAPAFDTTGASGAWVRSFDGAIMSSWFGVKGDDATDCVDGINSAIAVATLLGKREIRLPSGVVRHSDEINVNSGYISIEGGGIGATTLRRTHLSGLRFNLGSGLDSITIRNMSMDVAGNAIVTAGAEIYVEKATNLFFENLVIAGGFHGIYLVGCFEVHLNKVATTYGGTTYSDQRSIFIQRAADGTRSGNIFIDGCSIRTAFGAAGTPGAQCGIFVDVVDGLFVSNSYLGYFGDSAVSITNQVDDWLTGIQFSNCWFDFSTGNGVTISGSIGSNCSNIKFVGCTFLGGVGGAYGLQIEGNAFDVIASGNKFSWTTEDLVRVNTTGKGIQIICNNMSLADSDDASGGESINIVNCASAIITGNDIDGQSKTENGIRIAGGSRVIANDNIVYACTNGVLTTGALDYYTIQNNILFGNSGAPVVDGATGTHKSVANNVS